MASSIGDPVTGTSRPESETTKCMRLLWPARRIEAGKSDALRLTASLTWMMFAWHQTDACDLRSKFLEAYEIYPMVFAEHYDSFVCRQTGVIFGGLGLSFIPADFQPSACHFASGVFDPP